MKIGNNEVCPCGSKKKYKHCCGAPKATKYEPILILFGAGASFGSLGMTNIPPKGPELFDKLRENFCTWHAISGPYYDKFKNTGNFEEGMAALYEPPQQHNVNNLLLDMGIFFSKFKIDEFDNNLYWKLFNKYKNQIITGEIILATLNYECIIEYALTNLGINFDYFGDNYGVKLLKLHGSCNFIPQMVKVARENNAKIEIGSSNFYGPLIAVPPEDTEQKLADGGFLPAMSLYAKGKKVIACSTQIDSIQKAFQDTAKMAKAIISIGVRPVPEDTHIWEPISKSYAELFLITGNTDFQQLKSQIRNYKVDQIGEKFEPSFYELCNTIDKRVKH